MIHEILGIILIVLLAAWCWMLSKGVGHLRRRTAQSAGDIMLHHGELHLKINDFKEHEFKPFKNSLQGQLEHCKGDIKKLESRMDNIDNGWKVMEKVLDKVEKLK